MISSNRVLLPIEGAVLVDVGELDRVADLETARIGLLLAGDHAEQGGLAGAVGADHADDAAGRQHEVHLLVEQPVAVALGDIPGLDDDAAEPRSRRDVNLHVALLLGGILAEQLLVGVDAGLALGMPGLGAHANPLEFALQGLLPVAFRLFLPAQALLLLLQPARIVALPGDAVAAVQFEDPAGDVVEEVAVVGDGDDGPRIALQVLLQPGDGLGVEVVGRLVEQQDVGLLQQQAAQGDPPLLAAGEDFDPGLAGRTAQGVHGQVEARIELPGVEGVELVLNHCLALAERFHVGIGLGEGGVDLFEFLEQIDGLLHALLDHFAHRLGAVDQGLLLEEADAVAVGKDRLAVELLVDAGHDPEQGRLTGAIETEHADLGAVEIGEGNVLDDRLAVVVLVDPDHRVDNFLGIFAHEFVPGERCFTEEGLYTICGISASRASFQGGSAGLAGEGLEPSSMNDAAGRVQLCSALWCSRDRRAALFP